MLKNVLLLNELEILLVGMNNRDVWYHDLIKDVS
jgi:hypothetical protein